MGFEMIALFVLIALVCFIGLKGMRIIGGLLLLAIVLALQAGIH
jgi:hypothetical protein